MLYVIIIVIISCRIYVFLILDNYNFLYQGDGWILVVFFLSALIHQRAICYYEVFTHFCRVKQKLSYSAILVASQRFFLLFIKHHLARKLSKLSRGTFAQFTRLRHFFEKANQTVLSNNYSTKSILYKNTIQLTRRSISSSLKKSRAEKVAAIKCIHVENI